MKICLLLFTLYFISITVFAQVTAIPGKDLLKTKFNEAEGTQLTEADNIMISAEKQLLQFNAMDRILEETFKKKSKKKAEKKSVVAKKARINAAKTFQKAFILYYELFDAKINSMPIEFPKDDADAKINLKDASEDFQNAQSILLKYVDLKEKDLGTTVFQNLKSDLNSMNEKFAAALENQEKAIILWNSQAEKKAQLEKDEKDWNEAVRQNTSSSFDGYLDAHSAGIHAADAKIQYDKILDLAKKTEELKLKEVEVQKNRLIYKVQILSKTVELTEEQFKNYSSDLGPSFGMFYDAKNKHFLYLSGEFEKYDDASKYAKTLKYEGVFIVSIKNGVLILVKDAKAIELEKK